MQGQTNTNAEANIQNALNLSESNERLRAEITREEQSRFSRDEDLQAQIDKSAEAGINNALNIHQEAEQRRRSDEHIEALKEESGRQSEIDDYHQRQIDGAILSILQNILTLSESLSRVRMALHREEQSRFDEDSGLQSQTNTNAEAVIRNALNIQEEADKRRQLLARLIEEKHDREHQIQDLRAEIGTLYEIPLPGLDAQLAGLQGQADKNAEAGMRNALNLSDEAERRRGASDTLNAVIEYQQLQIDGIIHAIIEDALNLHDEVIRRKVSENEERQSRFNEDTALRSQIDTAVQGILRNTLTLSETLSRQREALKQEALTRTEHDAGILSQVKSLALASTQHVLDTAAMNAERRHEEAQERHSRVEQDDGLQGQMNQLAIANMWLAVREHETSRKVKAIEIEAESIPTRAATDEEFDAMLDELYNKP